MEMSEKKYKKGGYWGKALSTYLVLSQNL